MVLDVLTADTLMKFEHQVRCRQAAKTWLAASTQRHAPSFIPTIRRAM
jgi:hypothetical protein